MKQNKVLVHMENVDLRFGLYERHRSLQVLRDIRVDIHEGEFFVFLGPSGSGKSTLLRIMSGLERGYTGTVKFSDSITMDDVSFVFQQFALFPWLTAYDNIALGLRSRREKESMIHKKVSAVLTELGLEKFSQSYPRELSGGMKQRVGIARALVTEPKIIFMDEPFSGLDSFTAGVLRKELLDIWTERCMTIVLVTHLVSEALELADRIAVLTPRPATIEKIIHNTLPRPRQMRTESFFELEDTITKLVKP